MRAKYSLPITGLDWDYVTLTDTAPISLNRTIISWQMADGKPSGLLLEIRGFPVTQANGFLVRRHQEIDDEAFRAASYVANLLRLTTGKDVCVPSNILAMDPELEPDTPEEQELIARKPTVFTASFPMHLSCGGTLSLKDQQHIYANDVTLSIYTDALRMDDYLSRYTQLFKIIDFHFDNGPGKGINPDEVSSYAQQHNDSCLTRDRVEELKALRHRCTHPRQAGGFLGSYDLGAIREVRAALPDLQRLALLLLNHPRR